MAKAKLRLKHKKKPSLALKRIKNSVGPIDQEYTSDLKGVVDARRDSEIKAKTATATVKSELAKAGRETMSTIYYDENQQEITPEQIGIYQDIVASFYQNFVCLTDEQILDLKIKLPREINGVKVKIGHKAVFPPVLDTERKKISRGRVIQKANRLRYIENDHNRGLKMPEDLDDLLSGKTKKYEESYRARKDLVRTLMALNYNDYEMCDYLNIDVKVLSKLKKEVFFEELAVHKQMTNEELFIQYKLQQMEIVKDFDVIVERFKNSKQLTALAAALKAKAEIYNDIISKGYDFGVIEKTPEKTALLVGNLDINAASITELKSAMAKNASEMEKLVGSGTFLTEDDDVS